MPCLALLLVTMAAANPSAVTPEPLWPQAAPGALGNEDADRPTITTYLPARGTRPAAGVVIFPGGGYTRLAMGHEGEEVARWLNARGVAAFVVKYRLGPRYRHPAPLQDARRAVRTVRARAKALGLASDRIGVLGFSAGGHLASTVSTDPGTPDAKAADAIDRQSARPDFAVLAYPVIAMTGAHAHAGSRKALLGEPAPAALAEQLSNDRRVDGRTPPTFLFHTADDSAVPVENSLTYFAALRRAGVPAELHVFERGKHGVGLAAADPVLSAWADRLDAWLRARGLVTEAAQR
jgi:acetyl esterase/lipase